MASFHVQNFGCRATQADGAAIERQFQDLGMDESSPEKAEIVVLNTCTVTASADQDARAAIRRIRRQNPACQIVVTGCYAQRAPEEIAGLAGVSCVIGNSHKNQLAEVALKQLFHNGGSDASAPTGGFVALSTLIRPIPKDRIFVSDIFAHTRLEAAPVFDAANERTRPNLKVQDGCDNRCSFCVIPYVRGHSRSLALSEIINEINGLVDSGYQEVVISGINLGRWGRDLTPQQRFEDLIYEILVETHLRKLRISSVEPMDWSLELIRLMAETSRIAKHAHVPLQSGSDRVLRMMHRKYRPWHYREKLEQIRAAMPTAAIGADVMVGFPGESDADFEETRRLIQQLPLTYLHVFNYSARPGTAASLMKEQIPVTVARERSRILHQLASGKKFEFMNSFVGNTVEAITLKGFDGEYTEALTDNFLKLHLRGKHEANRWLQVQVERVANDMLVAKPSFDKSQETNLGQQTAA